MDATTRLDSPESFCVTNQLANGHHGKEVISVYVKKDMRYKEMVAFPLMERYNSSVISQISLNICDFFMCFLVGALRGT